MARHHDDDIWLCTTTKERNDGRYIYSKKRLILNIYIFIFF